VEVRVGWPLSRVIRVVRAVLDHQHERRPSRISIGSHQTAKPPGGPPPPAPAKPSGAIRARTAAVARALQRRKIDETREAVTSPFRRAHRGSSSEWVIHIVDLADRRSSSTGSARLRRARTIRGALIATAAAARTGHPNGGPRYGHSVAWTRWWPPAALVATRFDRRAFADPRVDSPRRFGTRTPQASAWLAAYVGTFGVAVIAYPRIMLESNHTPPSWYPGVFEYTLNRPSTVGVRLLCPSSSGISACTLPPGFSISASTCGASCHPRLFLPSCG